MRERTTPGRGIRNWTLLTDHPALNQHRQGFMEKIVLHLFDKYNSERIITYCTSRALFYLKFSRFN